MGNLFGGLARPGNNRGATAEAIPVVRDKATESEKEPERYTTNIMQFNAAVRTFTFVLS